MAQTDYLPIQIKRQFSHGWMTKNTKLVELIGGYEMTTDGTDDFTRYGTYKHLRTDSTGFFYVKKINGRWWMIDPDGYAGINMAVSALPEIKIQDNYDILKHNGFNASGNFLANENQTNDIYNNDNYHNFTYTRRPNFYLKYQFRRHNYYPTPDNVRGSYNHVLVLDPYFQQWCDSVAQAEVLPYKDDRNLLGYFSDNEINFNQDQLKNLVSDLPADDPSRLAALEFATTNGLTESDVINNNIPEAIKRDFATHLANHYFSTIKEAIHRYDTNHLILGARLHGRPRGIPGVVEASHKHTDVTSVNFYDYFSPAEQIARPEWTQDHPIIVGEFYVKDINQFNVSQPGAGWYVNGQNYRGYFYQNSCIEFLEDGNFIGWHYFKFQDDNDSNKGMISHGNNGTEYYEMTQYMKQLNSQVYRLIDHFDEVNRRPNDDYYSVIVDASEDTYLHPVESSNTDYGAEQELEVYYYWNADGRSEAYIRFDLEPYKENLPQLKNARLEVHVTESNQNNRAIFASGISDQSWNQETLNGQTAHTNTNWNHTRNRLSFNKGIISPGMLSFEVTNWVTAEQENGLVSFKIHDTKETTQPLKIASSESSTSSNRPHLVLTFWGEDINASAPVRKKETFDYFVTNDNLIKISNTSDKFSQYQIIGLSGQVMMSGILNSNVVDASHLQTGLYILHLTGDSSAAIKVYIK
jgi:hypothetical protein